MSHKILQSPLLSLPTELLLLVISHCGSQDIRFFLEALPNKSPLFRLFELFVVDEKEPGFYYKRPELCRKSVATAGTGPRALVTLFELRNDLEPKSISGLVVTAIEAFQINTTTTFIAVDNCSRWEDKKQDLMIHFGLFIDHLPQAHFVYLNADSVTLFLEDCADPSRIHIKDCQHLVLHQGNAHTHGGGVRLDNISRLDYSLAVRQSSADLMFDFSKEPRKELALRCFTKPFELVGQTIACPSIKLFNCERFERVLLPNATELYLQYPTYPAKKWAPIIKAVTAPKITQLEVAEPSSGNCAPRIQDMDVSVKQAVTMLSYTCVVSSRICV